MNAFDDEYMDRFRKELGLRARMELLRVDKKQKAIAKIAKTSRPTVTRLLSGKAVEFDTFWRVLVAIGLNPIDVLAEAQDYLEKELEKERREKQDELAEGEQE